MRRDELKLVMQMVDMRHEPSKDDKMMNEWYAPSWTAAGCRGYEDGQNPQDTQSQTH